MIDAINANSAYNESTEAVSARKNLIREIEETFNEEIDKLYAVVSEEDQVDLVNDPFFAAGTRGVDRLRESLGMT